MTIDDGIPPWEEFMIPLLEYLHDGATRGRPEMYEIVSAAMRLSEDQLAIRLKGSGHVKAHNRIGWALSFMTRAGALERPSRARYAITNLGQTLLRTHAGGLKESDLKAIPAFADYVPKRTGAAPRVTEISGSPLDPVEQIESGIARINVSLEVDLLTRLGAQNPDFLERCVVELLVKMGYGGTEGKGTVLGGSGDGGVDGVIDQDPLGLARIYVQAKRYAADNIVGRPQIQGFVGALHGNQASQGVFITTSGFSKEAVEYAAGVNASVILIDGKRLANLMIQYGVGVQTVDTYQVVEVDEDYFE